MKIAAERKKESYVRKEDFCFKEPKRDILTISNLNYPRAY